MSDSNVTYGGGGFITAMIIACVAYLAYGTLQAAAAYVLLYLVTSVLVLVTVIPFIGIFIYVALAPVVGSAVMSFAGLAVGTGLYNAVLVYNGIIGLLVCAAMSIWLVTKAFD